MAAPNIVNVTTITGKSVGAALTTSSADIVTNPAASGKVYKINNITVANVNGTTAATVNILYYDAALTTSYHIAKLVSVPAAATLDVVSKSFYLEEGDKVQALASSNSYLEMVVSWEEIN
jgi:hypothetical protein